MQEKGGFYVGEAPMNSSGGLEELHGTMLVGSIVKAVR